MGIKDATVERFRSICKEKNMSYNELANRSGVTPSTVYSMLDKRRRDISLITVKKLVDGLDMSMAEFFSSEEFTGLDQELY